jgi:hypothetical protein
MLFAFVYFVHSFLFNMLVAPLLEGSWRYIGGGAIVFQAIKTYIFGKLVRYEFKVVVMRVTNQVFNFRTIEYPEGMLGLFLFLSHPN